MNENLMELNTFAADSGPRNENKNSLDWKNVIYGGNNNHIGLSLEDNLESRITVKINSENESLRDLNNTNVSMLNKSLEKRSTANVNGHETKRTKEEQELCGVTIITGTIDDSSKSKNFEKLTKIETLKDRAKDSESIEETSESESMKTDFDGGRTKEALEISGSELDGNGKTETRLEGEVNMLQKNELPRSERCNESIKTCRKNELVVFDNKMIFSQNNKVDSQTPTSNTPRTENRCTAVLSYRFRRPILTTNIKIENNERNFFALDNFKKKKSELYPMFQENIYFSDNLPQQLNDLFVPYHESCFDQRYINLDEYNTHNQLSFPRLDNILFPPTDMGDFGNPYLISSNENAFQYPSIYVSAAGLISVLLKDDISVEMTVDKTIRLVSHQRNMVAATNGRGSASCLYHPAVKVCQNATTTDVNLMTTQRKIRMTTDKIVLADHLNCYGFNYQAILPGIPDFPDISQDNSVNLLFSATGYGPAFVPHCMKLAGSAQYSNQMNGHVSVYINSIRIMQTGRGDVTVICGPKKIKMRALGNSLELQTHFTEMSVDRNWDLRLWRGSHSIFTAGSTLVVSNGKIEANLNRSGKLNMYKLPKRTPLFISA